MDELEAFNRIKEVKKTMLPCPFCGAQASIGESSHYNTAGDGAVHKFFGSCLNAFACGARAGMADTPEQAANIWNHRNGVLVSPWTS